MTPKIKTKIQLDTTTPPKEDWINRRWRPLMGYVYMCICIFDFIIFPIFWSIIQVLGQGQVENQWIPITLQGAGFLHISFCAILGITAYGRTKEKLARTESGNYNK
jgi:hypothetical protein